MGVPVHEDRKHFEFLVLEAAQAGLSCRSYSKNAMGIAVRSASSI
jgi:DNA-3-methyladenine glycosylase I